MDCSVASHGTDNAACVDKYVNCDVNDDKYIKLNTDDASRIISITDNTKCCPTTNCSKERDNTVNINNSVNTPINVDIHGTSSCDAAESISITRREGNDRSILNEINRSIDTQSAAHKSSDTLSYNQHLTNSRSYSGNDNYNGTGLISVTNLSTDSNNDDVITEYI